MGRHPVDMTGQSFGQWTVLSLSHYGGGYWVCRCGGCGRESHVLGSSLRRGASRRCRACALRDQREERQSA